MNLLATLILSFTLLISPTAFAEDDKKEDVKVEQEKPKTDLEKIIDLETESDVEEDPSVTFSPDGCDFEITFPDKPYTSKRCPEGVGKCYDLTGYTMVYNLSTTVEVSVTCVPSTPQNYSRYNERVIRAALNGMVERAEIGTHEIKFREYEDSRQGALIGSGTYGKQSRIYNAQLWIGQNSVFTVEAKLTGRAQGEADDAFGDILRSIQKK